MKEFHGEYKGEALATVNSTNTAAAVGSGSLPVFATPMMLALMEEATCEAASAFLDDGETTVGIIGSFDIIIIKCKLCAFEYTLTRIANRTVKIKNYCLISH